MVNWWVQGERRMRMSKSDLLELLRRAEHYLQDFQHFVSCESLDKLVDDIENALKQTNL